MMRKDKNKTREQLIDELITLREDLQIYESVIDKIPLGLTVWSLEDINDPASFRLIASNLSAKKSSDTIYGEPRGTDIGKASSSLLETIDPSLYIEAVRTGQVKRLPDLEYSSNENTPPEIYSVIVIPLEGNIVASFTQNITERKRAEEELRESEEFNSSLLDKAPNPVVVINPDTSLQYVNPALCELTGFSSGELLGIKAPYPWIREKAIPEALQMINESMRSALQRFEVLFQKKNGEKSWIEVSHTPMVADGEFKYLISNWVDITERKQAERELKLRAELLDNAGDAISLLDLDGIIRYVNEAYCRIHGYSREELIGMDIRKLRIPEVGVPVEARIEETLRKNAQVFETTHSRKDGTAIDLEIHARVIESGSRKYLLNVNNNP